jgi:hypothetical protein
MRTEVNVIAREHVGDHFHVSAAVAREAELAEQEKQVFDVPVDRADHFDRVLHSNDCGLGADDPSAVHGEALEAAEDLIRYH